MDANISQTATASGALPPRDGDWMQTFTGRQYWPLDPRPEDVDVLDIAHALSMQCRYAGHCQEFYSVAEHCVLLARAAPPEVALWALLHDAAEAYLVDVPRPIKRDLLGYQSVEERNMTAIAQAFELPGKMPAEIKALDGRILVDEREQNMSTPPAAWSDTGERIGLRLQYWTPSQARSMFLETFHALDFARWTAEVARLRECKEWAAMSDDRAYSNGIMVAYDRDIAAASRKRDAARLHIASDVAH